jgi:hypothetical protein
VFKKMLGSSREADARWGHQSRHLSGPSEVYPMNFLALHSFFSTCLYILLGTAFAFSVAALRYHPACPRWLLIVGVSTALVALLYGIFHTVTALEWVATALFLCYVGLLGAETNQLSSETIDRSTTTVTR